MDPAPAATPKSPTLPRGLSSAIPANLEPDHSSPEPYWPRLARALVVMFFAISLHIWGVHSPHPQEPFYASMASRIIASVLVSPPLPLAPPLRIVAVRMPAKSEPRVTLHTTVLNVPSLPGPPQSSRPTAPSPLLVPVGTSGTAMAMASAPATDGDSGTTAASPENAPIENPPAPVTVQPPVERRPVAAPIAPLSIVARDIPRAQPIVLPPDRKERDPLEDQRKQEKVVLAVVQQYTRALERLDLRATKAVYPSADDRELQRSFQSLERQQFHFASCDVKFSSSGDGANAWCKGNATYRPKVGPGGRLTNREWMFSLSRDGGGWQILEARTQ